jgi:hypothetical protein
MVLWNPKPLPFSFYLDMVHIRIDAGYSADGLDDLVLKVDAPHLEIDVLERTIANHRDIRSGRDASNEVVIRFVREGAVEMGLIVIVESITDPYHEFLLKVVL